MDDLILRLDRARSLSHRGGFDTMLGDGLLNLDLSPSKSVRRRARVIDH
eukprot:SAG31_NODE_31101_length_372_cov_0.758242_1_plen_48_part_10